MFNRVAKNFQISGLKKDFAHFCKKDISFKLNTSYYSKYSLRSFYKSQFNSFVGNLKIDN